MQCRSGEAACRIMCYVIEVSNTGKFGIDPIQSKDTASIADTKTNTNIKKKKKSIIE